MSTFLSSLLVFFFLCMHPCNARRLNVVDEVSGKHQFSLKVAEKIKFVEEGSTKTGRVIFERIAHASSNTTPTKPSNLESLDGKEDANSGNEIVESSSHLGLLEGRKVEGSKGAAHHGKQEVDASFNEGIAVTDYQPPHRKTPIHN